MPQMNVKTIMLYNNRKFRPQTVDAIEAALNGDKDCVCIPVDVSELNSFTQLTVMTPIVKTLRPPDAPKPPPAPPKKEDMSEKDQRKAARRE